MGDFGLHKVLAQAAKEQAERNKRPKPKRRTIAEAVKEEMERCCKDICPSCKKGIAVYEAINTWQYEAHDTWLHNVRVGTSEVVVSCAAKAIRERAAEDKQ